MGWNRPNRAKNVGNSSGGFPARSQDECGRWQRWNSSPSVWGILALALIVVGGGLVWWFFSERGDDEPESRPAKKRGEISERTSTPILATTKVQQKEEPKKSIGRVTAKGTPIPDKVMPDERGVMRYPNGQRWVDPNDLHIVKHPQKRKLFIRTCDNQLATLLTLDPTKMAPFLVGRRRPYGDAFIKDFHDSLNDTYETDPNDTEEEKAVRQMVIETRAELKAAMDRGEDIAKLMNDTQEELDRLCQYQDTLKKELQAIQYDESVSDKDFEDFLNAANQMLEKQGLKGLTMPNIVTRQARIKKMKELLSKKENSNE